MPGARHQSTGWSCTRKERKRERERPTWPAPKSRWDTNVREYKWMPTSERRRWEHILSSSLALDEISLHPVRDIFERPSIIVIVTAIFSYYTFNKPETSRYLIFPLNFVISKMRYRSLFTKNLLLLCSRTIFLYKYKMNNLHLIKEILL